MTDSPEKQIGPRGRLAIQTIAMPKDANANGDIFGGWLMSQMDLAGAVVAFECAQGRVVTVAVDAMTFKRPVLIGDVVSCYAEILRIGRSSMTVHIQAWARRRMSAGDMLQVTEGNYTYVAIDDAGRPRAVPAAAR